MSSVEKRVRQIISEQLGIPFGEIEATTSREDMGMDSLDDVELVMALEDEFEIEIPDDIAETWKVAQDLVTYFEGRAK